MRLDHLSRRRERSKTRQRLRVRVMCGNPCALMPCAHACGPPSSALRAPSPASGRREQTDHAFFANGELMRSSLSHDSVSRSLPCAGAAPKSKGLAFRVRSLRSLRNANGSFCSSGFGCESRLLREWRTDAILHYPTASLSRSLPCAGAGAAPKSKGLAFRLRSLRSLRSIRTSCFRSSQARQTRTVVSVLLSFGCESRFLRVSRTPTFRVH